MSLLLAFEMSQFPWLFHKKLHTSKVSHLSGEADWELEM